MIFRVFLCLKQHFTAQSLDEGSSFLYQGNEISVPPKTILQLERKSLVCLLIVYLLEQSQYKFLKHVPYLKH